MSADTQRQPQLEMPAGPRDDRLQAARRIDWRFLLSSPELGRVRVVGPPDPWLQRGLEEAADEVRLDSGGDHDEPSADTAIALSLEAAGAVVYTESFETYFGASLGAIVNDGDFRDPRVGVFVHATRWVHAGYLMSFFRDATRYDASIYLSMDLGTAFGASFIE